MQAIILAAGMGKRLGNLTHGNTKCMVEVNGVSLIDRVLIQLSRINLSKIIVVVGYKAETLKKYIGSRYDDKVNIEYIDNPIYDKTNNIYSLSLVKEEMTKDDTLLLESDIILEDGVLDMIVKNPNPDLALVAKYESWMDGTMVRIDEECNIVNFVPKKAFRYEDVPVYYKTVNVYKFSKNFTEHEYLPFLNAYCQVMGNNEYYEQVLRVITFLDKSTLKALPINDFKWYEIDDVQDLDIASTIFSSDEVKYKEFHKRYGGYWRFPNLLDFCYLVNPFFPTEELKNELRANFDILLSDYPSGMSVNSLLAAKNFGINQNYICVGNGAAELINVLLTEYSKSNQKVGIVYPTFEEYPNRLKRDQIEPFVVSSPGFRYSVLDLMEYYNNKKIKLLLLINPDNPSGNFIPKKDILKLVDWAFQKDITLLVDESFVDFTDDFASSSLLHDEDLEQHTNLIVMKSISKSYGVPGLRLGILASANANLISKIKKEVSIWNINSFAEFYMQIYSKYSKDYYKACLKFKSVRDEFFENLSKVPYLKVYPSQSNFFLVEIIQKYDCNQLIMKLIENNILVSNCSLKSYLKDSNYLRFAIRSREDNMLLVNMLLSF